MTRRIPRLQGGAECTLTAMADLAATTNRVPWARPPIDVDFQVLMFTSSGLLVRFLKVFEKSGYNSVKWVRYLTKAAGSYQIRVSCCLDGCLTCVLCSNSSHLVLRMEGHLSTCFASLSCLGTPPRHLRYHHYSISHLNIPYLRSYTQSRRSDWCTSSAA